MKTPDYFARVEKLVTGDSVTLKTLKAVLMYQFINAKASILSEPFVQAKFSFFDQTLSGQEERASRADSCLELVTKAYPNLVGKYFAVRRFSKAKMQLV